MFNFDRATQIAVLQREVKKVNPKIQTYFQLFDDAVMADIKTSSGYLLLEIKAYEHESDANVKIENYLKTLSLYLMKAKQEAA